MVQYLYLKGKKYRLDSWAPATIDDHVGFFITATPTETPRPPPAVTPGMRVRCKNDGREYRTDRDAALFYGIHPSMVGKIANGHRKPKEWDFERLDN